MAEWKAFTNLSSSLWIWKMFLFSSGWTLQFPPVQPSRWIDNTAGKGRNMYLIWADISHHHTPSLTSPLSFPPLSVAMTLTVPEWATPVLHSLVKPTGVNTPTVLLILILILILTDPGGVEVICFVTLETERFILKESLCTSFVIVKSSLPSTSSRTTTSITIMILQ